MFWLIFTSIEILKSELEQMLSKKGVKPGEVGFLHGAGSFWRPHLVILLGHVPFPA